MRRFLSNRDGNFALMFALLTVPIFGATGMAVEYTRAVSAKSYFQSVADEAALSAARTGQDGKSDQETARILAAAKSNAESSYGFPFRAGDIDVTGKWLSDQVYSVTVSGTMATAILAAIPGFPHAIAISASATAEAGEPKYTYSEPKFKSLDPDAYDYNQLSVYCYDPEAASKQKSHGYGKALGHYKTHGQGKALGHDKTHDGIQSDGRSQFTVIADNANTSYKYTMPTCGAGEYLSFQLHNVRNALHDAENEGGPGSLIDKIKKLEKNADVYDYYTDTVIHGGVENYKLAEPMLETVLCDSYEACTPQSKGGTIPEGANRTPEHATQACAPGKYLYYGWEDRPPSAGSDRDYNDIRVVMECPTVTIVGYANTRLIR